MMMDNNFEKAFGEYLDSAEYDTIAAGGSLPASGHIFEGYGEKNEP